MSIPRIRAAARRRLFIVSAAALFGFSSCFLFPGSSSDGDTVSITEDLSNKTYYDLDFTDADTVELTLTGLSGKTLLLAKMNKGASSAIAEATGSAELVSPSASYSSRSARSVGAAELPGGRPPRIPHKLATEALSSSPSAATAASSRAASSREEAETIVYGNNSTYTEDTTTQQFWVDYTQNGATKFSKITATLQAVTAHAYFWVVGEGEFTTDEVKTNSINVTSEKIDLLAEAFEAVVFPVVTDIYGFEKGGGDGGDGGIDGDQHISILIYDIYFDTNSSSSGYVAGYFWSKDDADTTTVDDPTATYTAGYPSNGREIFYLDACALEAYPWTIVSTLAHEYQHMINYNQEILGRTAASTWLDEFRSLGTEDLLAPAFAAFAEAKESDYPGLDPYDFYLDGPGYWTWYLNYYYYLAGMETWGGDLSDYAYASMTAAYLMRAYGGVQFMRDAVDNADAKLSASEAFYTAVTNAAAPAPGAALTSIEDFYPDILGPFVCALWGFGADGSAGTSPLTRSDAAAAPYNTNPLFLNALSVKDLSDSYSIHPGYAQDRTGTFDYHYCFGIESAAAIRSYSFTLHTDDALVGLGQNTVELTLTAPANENVAYRLIVIE